MNPDPLEVEMLVGEDQRRLSVAVSAPRPIDDEMQEPHRVSIADVEAFRRSLAPRPPVNEIDELVSDLRSVGSEETR